MASRKVAGGGRRKSNTRVTTTRGKRRQVQSDKKDSFTKKRRAEFLAVLADTCNVNLACRETNVVRSTVYKRRKTDAAFRKGWQEALATAYHKLELVLLERAFAGTEKIVTRKDGGEERVREFPNAMALQLLKMHRDSVVESEREFSDQEADEIRERLFAKLKRLKAREEGNPAE